MRKPTLWTNPIKDKLIRYVNQQANQGMTQKDAFKSFCEDMGPQFKPSTASTVYHQHRKKLENEEATPEPEPTQIKFDESKRTRTEYTDDEERKLLLGSQFAADLGLRKRDVSRYISENTGRTLRAVDQKMNTLQRLHREGKLDAEHLQVPSECPEDILQFLIEVDAAKHPKQQHEEHQVDAQAESEVSVTSESEQVVALAVAETEDMDVFEVLGHMSRASRKIEGLDFDSFLKQLAVISSMAADRSDVGNLRNENFNLTRELNKAQNEASQKERTIKELEAKVEFLEQKIQEYDKHMKKMKNGYDILNFTIQELTNMRTIDQVTALKSLVNKVKQEVDDFGTIVKVVDVWREKFDEQLKEMYSRPEEMVKVS